MEFFVYNPFFVYSFDAQAVYIATTQRKNYPLMHFEQTP